MIDFNRLTDYSQQILFASQQVMARMHNSQMEPEHILIAMTEATEGICQDYLKELNINNKNFSDRLLAEIQKFPRIENPVQNQQLYLSGLTYSLFDKAKEEAEALKDSFISIEHILLAMVSLDNSNIKDFLSSFKVQKDTILKAMKKIRGNNRVDNKNAEDQFKALEKYSTDLTEMARKGKLDPVIGRDEEVRRVIQVLNRKT